MFSHASLQAANKLFVSFCLCFVCLGAAKKETLEVRFKEVALGYLAF
jgi:hypothetical protein